MTRDAEELLRASILGVPQKAMAIERGLSASSVTLRLKAIVGAMGLRCKVSALPPAVVMAGLDYYLSEVGGGSAVSTRLHKAPARRGDELVFMTKLPAPPALSQSEARIFQLLVEGLSRADIARIRCTSPRTIANQISTVFHKLNVSNRLGSIRAAWEMHCARVSAPIGPACGGIRLLGSVVPATE